VLFAITELLIMVKHGSSIDAAVSVSAAKCSTCTIRVQIFSPNLAADAFLTTEKRALAKPLTTFRPTTLAIVFKVLHGI
jgi:hypothetical protein